MSNCYDFMNQCSKMKGNAQEDCSEKFKNICKYGLTKKKFESPYAIGYYTPGGGYYDGSFTQDEIAAMQGY